MRGLVVLGLVMGCGSVDADQVDGTSIVDTVGGAVAVEWGYWELDMLVVSQDGDCEIMNLSPQDEKTEAFVEVDQGNGVRFNHPFWRDGLTGIRTGRRVLLDQEEPFPYAFDDESYAVSWEFQLTSGSPTVMVGSSERIFDLPNGLCEVQYEVTMKWKYYQPPPSS